MSFMTRAKSADWERLMYEIIGSISTSDMPIVFKGAFITKLVLAENKFESFERPTVDIDANWTCKPPTVGDMVGGINKALANVSVDLYAKLTREYSENKSAGIIIFERASGDPLVEMDISMSNSQKSRLYHRDELIIRGVLPTEILADKISVLSSNKIFRRAKDLVDVYALAHCVEVRTTEIYESHRRNERVLGSFAEFNTRKDDLSHAYQKLRGIENKPNFEDVYQYVGKFVKPFGLGYEVDQLWLPKSFDWIDPVIDIEEPGHTKKRTLAEKLELGKEKVAEQDRQKEALPQPKRKNDHEL